jgi:hypothetical protein
MRSAASADTALGHAMGLSNEDAGVVLFVLLVAVAAL